MLDGTKKIKDTFNQIATMDWVKSFGLGVDNWSEALSVDLNTLTTAGLYVVDATSSNRPGFGAYFVWVSGVRAGGCVQKAVRYDLQSAPVEMYIRRLNNGVWTDWKVVWNEENLPNPARTDTANTFSWVQTFTHPARFGGDQPIIMIGRPGDTEGKRNFRFDIIGDLFRLQALNDEESWLRELMEFDHDGTVVRFGNGNINLLWGSGSPEGSVTARPGSIYITSATPGQLWIKDNGTGNTGWRQVQLA